MSGLGQTMSEDAWQQARHGIVWALLRALANVIILVGVYYLLPLDAPVGRATLGWLLGGLAGFTILVALELRSILRSRRPGLRAIETLGVTVPAFLLVFASTYLMLSTARPQAFTESLNHTDALYFTMTVFSTVGFGDITPRSEAARVIVSAQMAGNLVVLGLLARVFVGAVQFSWRRRADDPVGSPARTSGQDPTQP
jgi:voltage-gated potassium channel